MTRRHSGFIVASILVCVSTAFACIWDRDTLRQEAAGLPGVVDVITGNFDRFPPSYYEARLERVAAQLEHAEPSAETLARYDDAGVACDRLGRCDEAIAWMAKKRTMLDGLDVGNWEHEYRYLANLGTFHAHRWIKRGARRESDTDLADLTRAIELISAAIEWNPDAHFGRESMQLAFLEVIRDRVLGEDAMLEDVLYRDFEKSSQNQIDELTGLVVQGAAWESPEVYYVLSMSLSNSRRFSMSQLADLRMRELLEQGRGLGLFEALPRELERSAPSGEEADYFVAARAYADARHAARVAYIDAEIAAGRHPDTHEDFWAGFAFDARPPRLPNGFFGVTWSDVENSWVELTVVGGLGLASILAVLRRRRRAKREALAAA